MNVNWFDIILLVLLLSSVISGLRSGFARVVIGLISALAGILLAFWSYRIVAQPLRPYLHNDTVADFAGFLLVFLGVVALGTLLALLLSKLFQWVGLSWFNHLLGGAVGLIRGVLVAGALIAAIVSFSPSPAPDFLSRSYLVPYATALSSTFAQLAPRHLRDSFEQQMHNLKRYWPVHKQQRPVKEL